MCGHILAFAINESGYAGSVCYCHAVAGSFALPYNALALSKVVHPMFCILYRVFQMSLCTVQFVGGFGSHRLARNAN